MTISPDMTVAAVHTVHSPSPVQPHTPRKLPLPGPARAENRPTGTAIRPTQPVAIPPVVTALTADLAAGRAAAEAARQAYHAQLRLAGAR